jgi:hypothetical protein
MIDFFTIGIVLSQSLLEIGAPALLHDAGDRLSVSVGDLSLRLPRKGLLVGSVGPFLRWTHTPGSSAFKYSDGESCSLKYSTLRAFRAKGRFSGRLTVAVEPCRG